MAARATFALSGNELFLRDLLIIFCFFYDINDAKTEAFNLALLRKTLGAAL
ncbi:MAG: hypothetical protein ACI9OI_000607 [Chitinophagales bacterium]|jgi:hypothetical protein